MGTHPIITMSNDPAGCAVGHDGQLLDASQIQWYHDVDDHNPLSPAVTSNTATSSSLKIRVPRPAAKVAGQRRSERVPQASRRLTDPANAVRIGKRKASSAGFSSQDESVPRDWSHGNGSDDAVDIPMDTDTNPSDGLGVTEMTDDDRASESNQMSAAVLGDIDRVDMVRPKSDRTADIRTIFTPDEVINTVTKKKEKGHWCSICKAKGVATKHSFLTGSVTSLRLHIARHKDHVTAYKTRCEKAGVPFHPRALPKDDKVSGQTTLDAHVVSQPRVPAFTTAGLLDYIVELIVLEDDAFLLVDKGHFRRLLQYMRPGLSDKDIPHRKKVRDEILQRAKLVESRIKERLQTIEGRVSFTFDAWTSEAQDPYLSVTGHYISTSDSQKWELHTEQLAFTPIEGSHSGANIAKIITRIIDRYDIRNKVGWFTADNASNNDTAIRSFAENVPEAGIENYRERRIRCMEHALHLAAGHFVDDISPTSSSELTKRLRAAAKIIKNAQLAGAVDLDELDVKVEAAMRACDESESESESEDEDFDVADALGKALALVTQIRKSPQARVFFRETCREVNVPELMLLQWVRTRWASLYTCLERFLKLRKAIMRFVKEADDSDKVPTLKQKQYADYKLSSTEWEHLVRVHRALQEPASATQSFSATTQPSLSRSIPVLEFLSQSWEDLRDNSDYETLAAPLQAGLDNLGKWYRSTDESDAYFITMGKT